VLLGSHEGIDWQQPHTHQLREQINGAVYDLILANDVDASPSAFAISNGRCPVVLNAHEYPPEEVPRIGGISLIISKHKAWLCQNYLVNSHPKLGHFCSPKTRPLEQYWAGDFSGEVGRGSGFISS